MKKSILLILALCYCLQSFGFSNVSFIGSLPEAKYKAATEGKLYMVKFTASWCMPCRWMDKNTFSDTRVQNYIGSNYVPVSIDVDDFDGMVIKQQYEVQVLPTIIIFNSKGEEVSRFEESLGPSRLLSILEEYNVPANNIKTQAVKPKVEEEVLEEEQPPLIISRPHLPKVITEEERIEEITVPEEKTIEEVVQSEEPKIIKEEPVFDEPVITHEPQDELIITEVVIEQPGTRTEMPQPNIDNHTYSGSSTTTSTPIVKNKEETAFLTGEGIFEIDVKFQEKIGYSIQIGVYREYNNVLSEVNKFKNKYGERVFVHIGKLNGATIYRLLLGHFQDSQYAQTKKIGLEAEGIVCYVRNLQDM